MGTDRSEAAATAVRAVARQQLPSPPDAASSANGMAAVRQRLRELVQRSLGELPVSHGPPGIRANTERCVSLYLLEIGPSATQARQPRVLLFNARFLVTVWGPDEAVAADDLAELVYAVLDESDLELGLEPLPPGIWAAFGTSPRPSFTISAPVRRLRSARAVAPVREAVLRLTSATVPLRGHLLETQETPIAGARIELPALAISTHTDAKGCFEFASVPAGRPLRLVARARGMSTTYEVQMTQGDSAFVILHMSLQQPQS